MQRLPGGSCQVNDGPLMFTSPTGQIHRGNHRRNDVIELGESGDDGVAKWGSYQGNTMSTAFPNGAARAPHQLEASSVNRRSTAITERQLLPGARRCSYDPTNENKA